MFPDPEAAGTPTSRFVVTDRCERAYVAAAKTATRSGTKTTSAAKPTTADEDTAAVDETATPETKSSGRKTAAKKAPAKSAKTTRTRKTTTKSDKAKTTTRSKASKSTSKAKSKKSAELDEGFDSPELEDVDLSDLDVDAVEVDVVDATVTEDTDESDEESDANDPDFVWDEEESEALRQARKDAELTASADSVRAYLKQIGKVALLNAEEEVELAKRIEAGLYAAERLRIAEEEGEKLSTQMRRDLKWIVRDGERAKSHLLEANLRLVVSLAKRYTGRGMAFLDLRATWA